ncbi:hypothetical protein ROHU_018903 [Labeo rohita]|uniref:Uncharacterized protein n=1 Tax=Labeo rohita TaxID=84645 RepID=A0A498NBH8_LABRO|nr:hypothetical protein ROHU_018903 [Labeo rohita]
MFEADLLMECEICCYVWTDRMEDTPPSCDIPNMDTPSGFLLLSSRDVPPAPQPASTGSHGMKGWPRKRVEV